MTKASALRLAGLIALPTFAGLAPSPALADEAICVDCISVRVGPPKVVRGPFPDELDATFSAIRLEDGSYRGFTANGATYAVEGASISDMGGSRRAVLEVGEPGSINDCGSWLTSTVRTAETLVGFVHQERACDYGVGRTDKSMAIATSNDNGLTWTNLGTVIAGTDQPLPDQITGEGDCSLVDGHDGFLYAYCLRNTDWQTIVARTPAQYPTDWRKFHEGGWTEPGLGGAATDIGFVGTGAGYLEEQDWVAAVATDPWFGGLRLSLSDNKISFVDLDEPLVPIDGADWNRPAPTDLSVYASILDPETGGSTVGNRFVLSYVLVPAGKGFESRYLVHRDVTLAVEATPPPAQAGIALSRWHEPETGRYISTTAPLTGAESAYQFDAIVAYALTRAPDDMLSVKLTECSGSRSGPLIAMEGKCASLGRAEGRTVGWLLEEQQAGFVPVYLCRADATASYLASANADCEGLGTMETRLGYGLAQ
ncbi:MULTISPECIES: hypothetical protein [Devosia]|uniref:hypothetical protein n=1 Tax=Devosia TaxID=46913 RepID=UPI001300B408|nr:MULTISPECIES: hypothetical protein [Devosia]